MTAKGTHFGGGNENVEASQPTTFADLGIPTEHQTRLTIIGTARTCSSLTKWEWLYLIGSVVSLLTSMILTMCTMLKLQNTTSFDFTFALVLIYTTVFCVYYVVHGVLKERPFELMVFVTTIFIILGYSILNYFSSEKTVLKQVRLILVCILGPILISVGIWLSREYYLSGNLVYRTVGANINLQSMCKLMFFCSTLLKFDLQLQGSMILLVMKNGTATDMTEGIILGTGISITIIFVAIGFLSMRFENKTLVIIFLILSISEPAYIIYLFYEGKTLQKILNYAVYIFGVLAIIVWFGSVLCMYFVAKNFGKGLKEKVYGDTAQNLASDPEVSLPSSQMEDTEKPGG